MILALIFRPNLIPPLPSLLIFCYPIFDNFNDRYFRQMKKYQKKGSLRRSPDEKLSIYILKMVGLGLAITAASLLSPTFLANFIYKYLKYKLNQPFTKEQIQQSLYYLKRKEFIAFPAKKPWGRMILTRLGKKRLSNSAMDELAINPVPWDGQWRFLTFDIPEKNKAARHIFRAKLKELGFFHFQKSVFLLPYPCEKEIDLVAKILKIEPDVHLITANRFPGDRPLIKKFHLKTF